MASLERGRVPSPRRIAIREIPLVDRAEEMKLLKEAVDRAIQGEGGIVFLYGEAGIGKTRLARELRAYAHLCGMQVLYGRCPALFRMDGVPPYIIWKEVIKDYLEKCTLDQLDRIIGLYPAEVAKLVPELSQRLGTIPQSFQISPEQEQNRLFEAVSQFITNIAREAPLLVILDDLQWTDPSSLLLLHYLARGVQKTSLLLLGAYRSTDVDSKHPLTSVLAELNRERLPESIQLKRMSLSDVSEMIRSILEQEDVPAEFCRLVYEKTKGNPFFAEEVVKSLKEEGVIYREGNKWAFKDVSSIEFPESVRNVVKARLGRLDEECQNVLTMASFIGNDFTLEAMCAVTGIEEDKLLKLLDKMFKTGLIKEQIVRGEGICSFADIMVRDVVYEEVSPLTRKKTHGIVGCALEKIYAETIDEHFGELALHFLEGGDEDKALVYFLKAGDRAAKIYANNEAVSYFQHALTLLEKKKGGLQERARVLEKLGDIRGFVGEHEAGMEHWENAMMLFEHAYENEAVARLHRKMGNSLWENLGNSEKADEHYAEALKILEKEPEGTELATLYTSLARMCYRTKDVSKTRSWSEKALELGKKLNDFEVIAGSYGSLGVVFGWTGDLKRAVECHERALKIALDNDCLEIAIREYHNLASSLPWSEIEKAMEYFEKGYELAKKAGDVSSLAWTCRSLGGLCIGMGNVERAKHLVEESLALNTKTGDKAQLSLSLRDLGLINQIRGEWDKAEQCYTEALSIARNLKDIQAISVSYGTLGWFNFEKGEYAKAKEHYKKMIEVVEKAGVTLFQWWGNHWLALIDIELGECEKVEEQIENLQKSALEAKDKDRIPHVYRLKATLLRAQKKWDESIEWFERSLQGFEARGARQWDQYILAKLVLYEYARVYLERNQEGDKEKAHDLLNQAMDIFQKLGAKRDIENAEARIAFIETGKVVSKTKLIGHVSTGHADLDRLLYGGIPPNYAIVLTSLSCNERDLLIRSFLETGAKNGEVTFYITIDASAAKALAEEFGSNFQLFVCNPEADAIIRSSPNVHTLKGVENLTDISIALTSAIRQLDPSLKDPRRICLDMVSDVLLYHHAVETRRWLTALMTKLKSDGFTILAVMDPEMHSSQDARAILDLFDGEINILEKETEKGPLGKYLKIKRMSNQKYLEHELPLRREDPK